MSAFDMGPALRPSALIRTTRWSLLLVGMWYGHRRYNQLLVQEDEIRAYNAKMKPQWDAEKAEKAAKENRANMLYLAKATGTPFDPEWHEQLHKDIIKEAISDNCVLCKK